MNKPTTTEIAKKEPMTAGADAMAIVPQTLQEVHEVAAILLKSGMAPKGVTLSGLAIRIMHGLEVGLKPLQAAQGICDINGSATIWGDAAIGLVQGSNLLKASKEWFTGTKGKDDWTAHCMVQRVGCEPHTVTYDVAEAKEAKLWGKAGPWTQYPKRMLMWRARGFAYRDQFADVLKGLRFAEEVRDIPARDIHWQDAEVEEAATGEGTKALMEQSLKEEVPAGAPAEETEAEATPKEGASPID